MKPASKKWSASAWFVGAAVAAAVALAFVGFTPNKEVSALPQVVVYKSPTCGCCNKWVRHLRDNGFQVQAYNRRDMAVVKREVGVPDGLTSCHTAKVGKYIVEGHVPADLISKMLREKPDIAGLSVPGMPMGSPGMEGPVRDRYSVIAFGDNGSKSVYAQR